MPVFPAGGSRLLTRFFQPSLLAVAICSAAAASPLLAEDWPQFRGPGGRGVSHESVSFPTTWGPNENIVWKTPLPGSGSSGPIVVGDRIALTAYTGYAQDELNPGQLEDLELHVLVLDRNTGKLMWERSFPASKHEQDFSRRVAEHGYATPTPAADETGIYTAFGVSGLVAYDWEGNERWRAHYGTKTAGFGSSSSPILHNGKVIINGSIESGTLYAFDQETGKTVWTKGGIKSSWSVPSLVVTPDGDEELVINQKDWIYGLDPESGEELWRCAGIDDYVVPSITWHDGIIYCLGGRTNRCIAVRTGGRGDVTKTHKLWETSVGANVTSPVYHDGYLYWASDFAIGCCLDAKTGETMYRERLPTRARIYASTVLADGKLYSTTRDLGVLVVKAAPKYEELALNTLEGPDSLFNAGPALHEGQILLRSNSFLYCIGERDRGARK